MINANIISNWINKPDSLVEKEIKELKSYANQFPYFLPMQYLNWFHEKDSKITLANLYEVHPVNQVLLHSFFNPTIVEPIAAKPVEELDLDEIKEIEEEEKEESESEELFASTVDYFTHQGVEVGHDLPLADVLPKNKSIVDSPEVEEKEQSLMVVMSYIEWLSYLQTKAKKEQEDKEGQKALKAMWQKQKIAEALEEENEEIPDAVFEMAVNSILPEEELISESLANVYAMQGKKDKAIEMFKKLSLRNPEKNGYFAQKIRNLQKENKI